MTQKDIVKLNCLNCNQYLGRYNPETKLYTPHIPKNRKQGDRFFVLPVIFTNKNNPTETYNLSGDNFIENQEIFGKDDLQKTKRLAIFQNGYLNSKGLMINMNRAKDIECGNFFTNCPKCNTHCNFELLRLEGKDDPLINWT